MRVVGLEGWSCRAKKGVRWVERTPTVWLTWLAKLEGSLKALEDSSWRMERR
jgi:hypothetical protein